MIKRTRVKLHIQPPETITVFPPKCIHPWMLRLYLEMIFLRIG